MSKRDDTDRSSRGRKGSDDQRSALRGVLPIAGSVAALGSGLALAAGGAARARARAQRRGRPPVFVLPIVLALLGLVVTMLVVRSRSPRGDSSTATGHLPVSEPVAVPETGPLPLPEGDPPAIDDPMGSPDRSGDAAAMGG